MALAAVFRIPGMNAQQYAKLLNDLEAEGEGHPRGRLYHVASQTADGWFVIDVWESREWFDAFGEVLVPMMAAAGVTPVEPEVHEVHNIIAG